MNTQTIICFTLTSFLFSIRNINQGCWAQEEGEQGPPPVVIPIVPGNAADAAANVPVTVCHISRPVLGEIVNNCDAFNPNNTDQPDISSQQSNETSSQQLLEHPAVNPPPAVHSTVGPSNSSFVI